MAIKRLVKEESLLSDDVEYIEWGNHSFSLYCFYIQISLTINNLVQLLFLNHTETNGNHIMARSLLNAVTII